MSETNNGQNPAGNPAPNGGQPNNGGAQVKEKFWTRVKNWCKRNKSALIAGGVGLGTGIAGTVGVAEYGKRRAEKQQAYVPQQEEHSPLDPNY